MFEEESMGILYVMTNRAMPGLVKVGIVETGVASGDLERRKAELSRPTGVPLPFECTHAIQVKNPRELESALHALLGDKRVNAKREFFEISAERFDLLFNYLGPEVVISTADDSAEPEEKAAIERAKGRTPNFNFNMIDMKLGSELELISDPNVVCRVIGLNPPRVEFEGVSYSLSSLVNKHRGGNWAGPTQWVDRITGKTLNELRWSSTERQNEE